MDEVIEEEEEEEEDSETKPTKGKKKLPPRKAAQKGRGNVKAEDSEEEFKEKKTRPTRRSDSISISWASCLFTSILGEW